LTNVSPAVTAPTLWNYTVCGQYPGAVGASATVSLQCTCATPLLIAYTSPVYIGVPRLQCTCGLPAYRYVIVQFDMNDMANFCELEVYIRRECMDTHLGTV